MLEFLFFIVLLLILCWVGYNEFHTRKFGVSTSHTSPKARAVMVGALREELSTDASLRIVDPGCGSGALARRLAKVFPCSTVVGLELSILPFYQAVFFKKIFGIENVVFKREDFFAYDYKQADVVVLFLPLPILEKLAPLLRKQMKPGSFVVSNVFQMPEGWDLHRGVSSETILKRNIYIYKIT